MNNLLRMNNNLIQNFYIIGLPIEEIINISSLESKEKSLDIYIDPTKVYSPKIITKFPPTNNNYNKIIDEFILDHIFPNGLKIKEDKKYNDYLYHFEFELDNTLYKFNDKNKSLYSKIHFTCLKFYESIKDYKKLKEQIYNKLNANGKEKQEKKEEEKEKDKDKEDKNGKAKTEDNNPNKIIVNEKSNFNFIIVDDGKMPTGGGPAYFIPKVICFASLLPFPDELQKILINIYDFYKYQSMKFNKVDYIHCPIEKLIEQIVMSLPLPISNKNDIILIFNIEHDNFDIKKNIFTYRKIFFYSYDLRDYYLNKTYNLSMIEIFNHFSEENTIKIFNYIILENPILFFCDNKELLSNIIEGFLNILYPFRYVLPHITILPSKYFGLIHSQDKFIFGINQSYSENFFQENEINLNKNIIIVSIVKANKNLTKIEEIFKKNDEKVKNIYINQEDSETTINLNNVDLPIKHKRKLLQKLKDYLNIIRNNFKKKILEKTCVFNNKVRHIFHKFFINILSGYTKYLVKCPNNGFFGDSIRHKYNGKNGLLKYIKEIFDIDGFISNFPKETQMFYKAFFNTELFFNFIRGIIYPNDEIDSLRHKFFDFMTFLKKYKEVRKEEDFEEQYEKLKKPFDSKKNCIKKNIVISNKFYFTDEEKKMLIDEKNQKTALIKYSQLIDLNENDNKISKTIFAIKYFIFPKLLFDNEFFKINYNEQFYYHFIELPNDIFITELNKSLIISESDFMSKYCLTLYPSVTNQKMSLTNFFFGQNINPINYSNSNPNPAISFELYIHNYIEYNWLLLLSCSLWYCNSNKEKEVRIKQIFNILEILDYIEEQVLYFIFFSLYKFSNISQFIRIFELLYRFIGSYTYSDLLYLFQKITNDSKKNEKDIENNIENINNDKDNKYIIEKRSFLDVTKYISNEEVDDKLKEEIIFTAEIVCDNCNEINKLDNQEISDLFNKKIEKNKNNFEYKCKNCEEINNEIIIKYIILLSNITKNKENKVAEGSFNLEMPHLLYQQLKIYVLNLKDNNIDIDHIFSNQNINLLNYIFYFTLNCLPFDFLIPYKNNANNKSDREYFTINNSLKEKEKTVNEDIIDDMQENIYLTKKFTELSFINNDNLCLSGKK